MKKIWNYSFILVVIIAASSCTEQSTEVKTTEDLTDTWLCVEMKEGGLFTNARASLVLNRQGQPPVSYKLTEKKGAVITLTRDGATNYTIDVDPAGAKSSKKVVQPVTLKFGGADVKIGSGNDFFGHGNSPAFIGATDTRAGVARSDIALVDLFANPNRSSISLDVHFSSKKNKEGTLFLSTSKAKFFDSEDQYCLDDINVTWGCTNTETKDPCR